MLRRGSILVLFGLILALGGPTLAEEAVAPPPLPADNPTPPPLPPAEPAAQFFVAENGKPVGPLSLEQVKARIQANQTKRTDLVWKAGTAAWMPAEQIAELKDAFGVAPPDVPADAQLKDFMIGIWEGSGTMAQGYEWTLRISYTADGRYSGYQTLTSNGVTSQQAVAGKWNVTPAGQNKFSLTLTPQGNMAVTAILTVIDQDTLYNEQEAYYAKRIGR